MKAALTDVISERIKNAFLANFVLSWVVVNNYTVVYILLSDDRPNKKLQYISGLKFDWQTDLFFPLLLVFAYIYLLPLINLALMKIKLKYIEPMLSAHRNDEQMFQYDKKIEIEDKRLELLFREKEREIELEEKRTKEQVRRTQAAEDEARFLTEKHATESKVLELERAKRTELEKVVTLETIVEREKALDQREQLLNMEKERLIQEGFKYDLNRHQAQWVKTDKPVSKGDKVTIDFVGTIDGQEFEGGKAENFPLILGQGRMIPGFEEGLLQRHSGEDVQVSLKFPEDYHASNLQGKQAQFQIKIKRVETQMIPVKTS